MHPAGFVNYAEFTYSNTLYDNVSVSSGQTRGISGTVNVTSGSITIDGTNTKFNLANTNSVLTIGTRIAVNNEIRTVNNIINNTTITVSSSFSYNAAAQSIIILT